METLVTAVLDFEPRLRKRKTFVVIAICLAGVILGLPFTTRVSLGGRVSAYM